MHDVSRTICDAIRTHHRLSFVYEGLPRVVEPYCHGWTAQGDEVLRAIQVGGRSRSGGFGFGKLWSVARLQQVRLGTESFVPNDRNYNPNDSAISEIDCRV